MQNGSSIALMHIQSLMRNFFRGTLRSLQESQHRRAFGGNFRSWKPRPLASNGRHGKGWLQHIGGSTPQSGWARDGCQWKGRQPVFKKGTARNCMRHAHRSTCRTQRKTSYHAMRSRLAAATDGKRRQCAIARRKAACRMRRVADDRSPGLPCARLSWPGISLAPADRSAP